jgi:hypothetical protein
MAKNQITLINNCLAFRVIIIKIDKLLKERSVFNLLDSPDTLIQSLNTKVNWTNILIIITKICFYLFEQVQSAEISLSLINLVTNLIEKCHYQCDGQILDSIKNSSLISIISNITDEFRQNAFLDMFKALLVAFPRSEIIVQLSLKFIANLFRVNNLILFVLERH